jgi:hypothetical protein
MRSSAKTVAAYLKSLPADRRKVVAAVRKVIRARLPKGYAETMNWGMISYEIPLKAYPDTYNGQPLAYAGLAAQKGNYALYLMCVYARAGAVDWLKQAFKKAGKKLDMGKSCIRFRNLEDLPLEAIGTVIASTPMKEYVAFYEKSRKR